MDLSRAQNTCFPPSSEIKVVPFDKLVPGNMYLICAWKYHGESNYPTGKKYATYFRGIYIDSVYVDSIFFYGRSESDNNSAHFRELEIFSEPNSTLQTNGIHLSVNDAEFRDAHDENIGDALLEEIKRTREAYFLASYTIFGEDKKRKAEKEKTDKEVVEADEEVVEIPERKLFKKDALRHQPQKQNTILNTDSTLIDKIIMLDNANIGILDLSTEQEDALRNEAVQMAQILSNEDINASDEDGNTPIFYALKANEFEIAKTIIMRGDVNLNHANRQGQTASNLLTEIIDPNDKRELIELYHSINRLPSLGNKRILLWVAAHGMCPTLSYETDNVTDHDIRKNAYKIPEHMTVNRFSLMPGLIYHLNNGEDIQLFNAIKENIGDILNLNIQEFREVQLGMLYDTNNGDHIEFNEYIQNGYGNVSTFHPGNLMLNKFIKSDWKRVSKEKIRTRETILNSEHVSNPVGEKYIVAGNAVVAFDEYGKVEIVFPFKNNPTASETTIGEILEELYYKYLVQNYSAVEITIIDTSCSEFNRGVNKRAAQNAYKKALRHPSLATQHSLGGKRKTKKRKFNNKRTRSRR
jgi:hypothetical protein